jgi:hypothetical protein
VCEAECLEKEKGFDLKSYLSLSSLFICCYLLIVILFSCCYVLVSELFSLSLIIWSFSWFLYV